MLSIPSQDHCALHTFIDTSDDCLQKCKRIDAVQTGLLEKICNLFHYWMEDGCEDDFSQEIVELLVCLLGPGDIPGALEDFLKHDAYSIGVRDCQMPMQEPANSMFLLELLCLIAQDFHEPVLFCV